MNAEIIKAMNKKETEIDKIRKWWSNNGYKVMRVILFPIWWGFKAEEKIDAYLDSRNTWSEERANEILSYYIPRNSDWDAEDKSFYFYDNGLGWDMRGHQKTIKLKDRRWWKNHTHAWGGKVRTYLIDKFELEGFEKTVGDTDDFCTEVTFKMIEE